MIYLSSYITIVIGRDLSLIFHHHRHLPRSVSHLTSPSPSAAICLSSRIAIVIRRDLSLISHHHRHPSRSISHHTLPWTSASIYFSSIIIIAISRDLSFIFHRHRLHSPVTAAAARTYEYPLRTGARCCLQLLRFSHRRYRHRHHHHHRLRRRPHRLQR